MAENKEPSLPVTTKSEEQHLQVDSPLQLGSRCPYCGKGSMEYNGLLNLECTFCHLELQGGVFT